MISGLLPIRGHCLGGSNLFGVSFAHPVEGEEAACPSLLMSSWRSRGCCKLRKPFYGTQKPAIETKSYTKR